MLTLAHGNLLEADVDALVNTPRSRTSSVVSTTWCG